jgi:hypothetical protein
MTKSNLFDSLYGKDLIKLATDIKNNGIYQILNADDYPSLFDDHKVPVKRIDFQFKDFS